MKDQLCGRVDVCACLCVLTCVRCDLFFTTWTDTEEEQMRKERKTNQRIDHLTSISKNNNDDYKETIQKIIKHTFDEP